MNSLLLTHSFEFAPNISRYRILSRSIFLLGLCFAVFGVAITINKHKALSFAQAKEEARLQVQKRSSKELRRLEQDPAAMALAKAQAQLEQMLQSPWSQLLEALEASADAVEGRVTLLSVVPSNSNSTERKIELTLLASSYPAMLAYVETLQSIGGFSSVRILSHQTEESAKKGALKFKVSAGWNQLKVGVFLTKTPTDNSLAAIESPRKFRRGL